MVNVLVSKPKGEKEFITKKYELNRNEHIPNFQYDFKELIESACKLSDEKEDVLYVDNELLISKLKIGKLDNITQLISSNNKVDGLLVNYDDISNDYDYYIPVVNQAISLNYKTVSDISDIKWKSYQIQLHH